MNNYKIKIYNLFLPFIYLYTVFPFATKTLPSLQFALLYIFIGIYIFIHFKDAKILLYDTFKRKNTIFLLFFLYLSICFFSLLSPCAHFTGDTSYFTAVIIGIFRNFLKSFFLLLITYRFILDKNTLFEYFLKYNIEAMVLYICSSIVFIFFPNIKLFWQGIIYEPPGNLRFVENLAYISRFGLAGFSGFRQTFQCTICYIFNLINIDLCNKKNKSNVYNLFIAIILVIGNSFYGRSGLMISLALTILYIGYDLFFNKNYKFFVYMSLALISLFIMLGIFRNNRLFDIWYRWSMAPVNSFLEKGKIGTNSSDDMFRRMSFMPEWETFAFGDGYWSSPSGKGYYMHTDLGYMRPMLFYGVFAEILAYLIPFVILFRIFLYRGIWRLFAILLFLQLFLFELKGEVFYIQTGIFLSCFISISCKQNKQLIT